MPIPAVTCAADISYSWNAGGGSQTAALSATATNSPTSWEWRILSVPVGLESLMVGVKGSFTDGVATIQNPTLPVPTATAFGTIVVQSRAANGDGPSEPTIDKEAGQQNIIIRDATLNIGFPGDFQYNWGLAALDLLLRAIRTLLGTHASRHNASGADALAIDAIAGTGSLRTLGTSATSACAGNDARLSDARTPIAHQASHVTGADQIPTATISARGLLPILGGGTTNYLRADGTWATPPGGGGFSGREQEFTATGGDQNFTLSATPATNANMLSGVNILGVYRNGQRMRYRGSLSVPPSTPATSLEYGYESGAPTTLVCKALTAGDLITILYSV